MTAKTRGKTDEKEPRPQARNPDEEQLDDALDRLPNGAVCKVYRYADDGTKEYVAQCAPEEATEEQLARRLGGGKYHLVFWGPKTADRRSGYYGSSTVRIAALATPATAVTAPGAPSFGDQVSKVMESGLVNLMQMQTAMLQQVQRPQVDWTERLPAILTAVGTVVGALAPFFKQREGSSLGEAERLAELLAKARAPSSSLEDMQKLVLFLRELREEAGSSGGGGGGGDDEGAGAMWRTLEKVGGPLVQKLLEAAPGGAPPAPGAALPPGASGNGTSATPPEGHMPDEYRVLMQHLPSLVQWSHQGRNPDWVAETLCYEIDPHYYPRVVALLEQPGFVEQLVSQVVALRPALGWVHQVREALIGQMSEAMTGGGGADGGSGAAGGSGSDAGAG